MIEGEIFNLFPWTYFFITICLDFVSSPVWTVFKSECKVTPGLNCTVFVVCFVIWKAIYWKHLDYVYNGHVYKKEKFIQKVHKMNTFFTFCNIYLFLIVLRKTSIWLEKWALGYNSKTFGYIPDIAKVWRRFVVHEATGIHHIYYIYCASFHLWWKKNLVRHKQCLIFLRTSMYAKFSINFYVFLNISNC